MSYNDTSSVNSSGNSNIQFRMGVEIVSQSINNGVPQSVVNVRLQTRRRSSSTTTYKQNAASTMTVNGTQYSKTIDYNVGSYTVDTWYTIWTKSGLTVSHNTSTGAKTLTVAFTINLSGTSASSGSGSWNVTLPTIPMGSTISSAPNVSMGTSNVTQSVGITCYNTAYYHKLEYKIGSTSAQIDTNGWTVSSSSATHSTTMTPGNWLPRFTTSSSVIVTVLLYTYSDSACTTQVGVTSQTTFTLTCTAVPSASISVVPRGQAYNNGVSTTVFFNGYSTAYVTFSGTGVQSSTITKLELYQDNVLLTTKNNPSGNQTYTTPSVLTGTGTKTFKVVATDSRGLTKETTTNITVAAYSKPTITNYQAYRCNSGGTATTTGTYLRVVATATATGAGNSITSLKVSTDLQSNVTLTSGTASTLGSASIQYAINTGYTVTFSATDKMGNTVTQTTTVSTSERAINVRDQGKGIAFGKFAENDNQVDSAWQYHSAKTGTNTGAAFYASSSSAADVAMTCRREDLQKSIVLLVGGGGTNRGLYEFHSDGDGWILYYNDTNLVLNKPISCSTSNSWSGTNTWSGESFFMAMARIKNSNRYPTITFRTNLATYGDNNAGEFAYDTGSTSNISGGRFRFIHHSYDSSSHTALTNYESYLLPTVNADKTSNDAYDIVTTKPNTTTTVTKTATGSSNPITAVSGITLTTYTFAKSGRTVQAYVSLKLSAALASNSTFTLTLHSDWQSVLSVVGNGQYGANSVNVYGGTSSDSGVVTVKNVGSSSIASGNSFTIRFMYLLP